MVYYAYSFIIGKTLMLSPNIKNGNEPYKGADVLSCLIGLIFGIFSMSMSIVNF